MERRRLIKLIVVSSGSGFITGCIGDNDASEGIEGSNENTHSNISGGEESDTEIPIEETQNSEFVDEVDGQVGLAYGDTARVSNGVEVTVYEGTIYDQMGEETPEERDQFLVVPIEAENTSDEPLTIPDSTDSWDVLFGNQQVGNVFNYGALDQEGYTAFEGGDVQGGVYREGVLLFGIDDGFGSGDTEIFWQDSLWVSGDLDGDISVLWSTNPT